MRKIVCITTSAFVLTITGRGDMDTDQSWYRPALQPHPAPDNLHQPQQFLENLLSTPQQNNIVKESVVLYARSHTPGHTFGGTLPTA